MGSHSGSLILEFSIVIVHHPMGNLLDLIKPKLPLIAEYDTKAGAFSTVADTTIRVDFGIGSASPILGSSIVIIHHRIPN